MRQSRPKYTNKSRNLSYCLFLETAVSWPEFLRNMTSSYDLFLVFLSSKSPFNVTPKLGYNSPLNSIWKSVTYQYWHFLCISYAKVESLKGPFISPFWYISSWRLFPYVYHRENQDINPVSLNAIRRKYGRVDLNASSIVAADTVRIQDSRGI